MRIGLIHGDGIGPEVIESAKKVLDAVDFDADYVYVNVGYERWKRDGVAITEEDIETLKGCNAILKGPTQSMPQYESPALKIRQSLDLYANVRPIESLPYSGKKFDLIIIRENTEGSYVGEYLIKRIREEYGIDIRNFRDDKSGLAVNTRIITRKCSERIARFAFDYARKHKRKKVCCVHKVNIIKETDGLFNDIFYEVSKDYPDIENSDMNIDACSMELIQKPYDFDIILTENLYGDILSGIAAGLTNIGILGSMNIGEKYALFEPVHGTAPDIAGSGNANPIAQIRSGQYMLEYLGCGNKAKRIEEAIENILIDRKVMTEDLGGTANTKELTEELIKKLKVIE